MFTKIKWPVLLFTLLICTAAKAQIEAAHLNTKNFAGFGVGAFLNVAVPVSEGSFITGEAGFYYFSHDDTHVALVPFLLGYRYMINGTGTGLYVEPTGGYTIGGTDIQKTDENGGYIADNNGHEIDQQAKGPTGGFVLGYIFPGNFGFNIGLRYEHTFVINDPALNMLSLRISHTLSFGQRRY